MKTDQPSRTHRHVGAHLLVTALALLLATRAPAQIDLWRGGSNQEWFSDANWTAGIPGTTTNADINNGGSARIANFGTAYALSLNLGRGAGQSGTLTTGFLSNLNLGLFMIVGNVGYGTLNVVNGGTVTDSSGIIGAFGDGFGVVTVSGGGARWTNTSALTLANGTLTISGGGMVRDVTGTAGADAVTRTTATTVTGAGSTWANTGTLNVGGYGGTDRVNITDGGLVSVTGQTSIAAGATISVGTGGAAGALQTGSVVANGTLRFNHTGAVTFTAPVTGSGFVQKDSAGATTVTNAAGFTGKFLVQGGDLTVRNTLNNASFQVINGGAAHLDAATVNLGIQAIQVNGDSGVTFNNTTVNGGYLRGPGTYTTLAGGTTTFNGVTTFNSTNLVLNGTANLNYFTNGGLLTSNAGATTKLDAFTNTSSGTLVINSFLNAQDLTTNGVLTINNGGSLAHRGGNLVAGGGGVSGGSRTTINTGGTVYISDGRTFELNGALLVNNGTISGNVNVNYGSLAKGGGNYNGTVTVNDGGRFSPGNSPGRVTVGALTLGGGGGYQFEVRDAAGAPGTGFDFIHALGRLTLDAGATPNGRFTIAVDSLDAADHPGLALNFDPTRDQSFRLLTADGGIVGFDPARFGVDVSGFLNDLDGGHFSLSESGNDLLLVFNAVPEPPTVALLLGVGTCLGVFPGRRVARRRARQTS